MIRPPYENFPKNTMEGFINDKYTLSIFPDGTWQRRILSKIWGRWERKGSNLILTPQGGSESETIQERTRTYRIAPDFETLYFENEQRAALYRISTKPTKFEDQEPSVK